MAEIKQEEEKIEILILEGSSPRYHSYSDYDEGHSFIIDSVGEWEHVTAKELEILNKYQYQGNYRIMVRKQIAKVMPKALEHWLTYAEKQKKADEKREREAAKREAERQAKAEERKLAKLKRDAEKLGLVLKSPT